MVDATVLLTGESGTGKGLLARAIHSESARARAPFVTVNCASVPESLFETEFFGHMRGAFTGAQQSHRGLLEQADRGSLFLDEVGELTAQLQAKLLTAVEDGEFRRVGGERVVRVDVRLLAATGIDLERAVLEGRFRRDLYHRLMVLSFRMPALRERPQDIELFARHYLERYARRYGRPIRGLESSTLARLHACPWPGNVRQLAHAIESAVLSCDGPHILPRHLPDSVLVPVGLVHVRGSVNEATTADVASDSMDGAAATAAPRLRYSHFGPRSDERRRIEDALRRWRGNKTRAARDLGMARNTLRAKLRSLPLEPGPAHPDRAPPPPPTD